MPLLDQVIHKHLDKMDELINSIDEEIDMAVKDINIDFVISDPQEALKSLNIWIYEEIIMPKMEKALKLGKQFAKDVKSDGEVIIQDTNNESINKEVLDG